jgi:phosphatidylserine/phosphatidylglycerophosphate/cardiolipin synthase-like enzyme
VIPAVPPALAHEIAVVSETLPMGALQSLTTAVQAADVTHWGYARQKILQGIPQQHWRDLVDSLLDLWRSQAAAVSPEAIALALLSAALASKRAREELQVDLIWTGPESQISLRRTDQALLEVIGLAQRHLLLVSFAVYKVPSLSTALVAAVRRGVLVDICLETPETSAGRMTGDTIRALGAGVAEKVNLYVWPQEKRLRDPAGHAGSLHAKCAVADEQALFVSSANLTEHAMNLNIELGVLLRGGRLPGEALQQFRRLIEQGVLTRIRG